MSEPNSLCHQFLTHLATLILRHSNLTNSTLTIGVNFPRHVFGHKAPYSSAGDAGAATRSSGNGVIGIRHDCGLVVLEHGRGDVTAVPVSGK